METLLTIGLCILAVLIEFAVAALIIAPKAAVRWLGRLVRRLWSTLVGAPHRIGDRLRSSDDELRASGPE